MTKLFDDFVITIHCAMKLRIHHSHPTHLPALGFGCYVGQDHDDATSLNTWALGLTTIDVTCCKEHIQDRQFLLIGFFFFEIRI